MVQKTLRQAVNKTLKEKCMEKKKTGFTPVHFFPVQHDNNSVVIPLEFCCHSFPSSLSLYLAYLTEKKTALFDTTVRTKESQIFILQKLRS